MRPEHRHEQTRPIMHSWTAYKPCWRERHNATVCKISKVFLNYYWCDVGRCRRCQGLFDCSTLTTSDFWVTDITWPMWTIDSMATSGLSCTRLQTQATRLLHQNTRIFTSANRSDRLFTQDADEMMTCGFCDVPSDLLYDVVSLEAADVLTEHRLRPLVVTELWL